MASLVAQLVKNLLETQEIWVRSLIRKILWSRKWQPTPVFLPGEFHGQRSLADHSPWDRKESDTTDRHRHLCVYVNPKLLIYPPTTTTFPLWYP